MKMCFSENKRLSITAWNVRGLADKVNDDFFTDQIKSDINILLETWKGDNKETQIPGFHCFSKIRKNSKKPSVIVVVF